MLKFEINKRQFTWTKQYVRFETQWTQNWYNYVQTTTQQATRRHRPWRHGTSGGSRTLHFLLYPHYTAPFSRLLRSRWGYGGAHSRLNPPGPHGGLRFAQRELQRQKAWNAAILVVVSARYSSKGWIQVGAKKKGRGRASPLTKSSFRPNVHSNILMYCRRHCWHMHLYESCHSGCLFFLLNCLLLVIRWVIKGL